MSKIYTRSGDDGTTGLLASQRLFKDNLRIEAFGTVDELNAALGVARASSLDPEADALLARVQGELFEVGSALADPEPDGPFHKAIGPDHTSRLEREIDAMVGHLQPLTRFILPGGSAAAALIHFARTICRRAERLVVQLARRPDEHVPEPLLIYLNRLSDFLFVLARAVNQRAGVADVAWTSP